MIGTAARDMTAFIPTIRLRCISKATDAEVVGKGEDFQKPTVSYTVASVPQTGDTTPLGMLLALAGLAAAALLILNAGRNSIHKFSSIFLWLRLM